MFRTFLRFILSVCLLFAVVDSNQRTFLYTGYVQIYTVPLGVTELLVSAYGAAGGVNSNTGCPPTTTAAYGGFISAVIPVYPNQSFSVYVGGIGSYKSPNMGGWGGSNGGNGDGKGGGGGGSTDFRYFNSALNGRVLVAGAGGGNGYSGGLAVGVCTLGGGGGGNSGASGAGTSGASGGSLIAGGSGWNSGVLGSGGNASLAFNNQGGKLLNILNIINIFMI